MNSLKLNAIFFHRQLFSNMIKSIAFETICRYQLSKQFRESTHWSQIFYSVINSISNQSTLWWLRNFLTLTSDSFQFPLERRSGWKFNIVSGLKDYFVHDLSSNWGILHFLLSFWCLSSDIGMGNSSDFYHMIRLTRMADQTESSVQRTGWLSKGFIWYRQSRNRFLLLYVI